MIQIRIFLISFILVISSEISTQANNPVEAKIPANIFGINMLGFNLEEIKQSILNNNGKIFPCEGEKVVTKNCFNSNYFIGEGIDLKDLVYVRYHRADFDMRINEINLVFKSIRYNDIKILLVDLYGIKYNLLKNYSGRSLKWVSDDRYNNFAITLSDYIVYGSNKNEPINKNYIELTLDYFDYSIKHGN